MQITINENQANQRFDRFLRKRCKTYPEVKLGDIYSRIRKGEIKVNGKKSKEEYRLQIGDEILIPEDALGKKDLSSLISPKERKLKKLDIKEIKPRIIFEDENRLVFNKPYGIVMHESNKHRNDLSMNDYLEAYCKDEENPTFKPSFGYRLDKDTSGVLIAAKNYDTLQYINSIIRERKIEKFYKTIVVGTTPDHFIMNESIEKGYNKNFDRAQMKINKENGLESKTECRTEKTIHHQILGEISFLKVKIYTGRMHQIRIHLSHKGYPVLGDLIYGNPAINRKLYKQLTISRQLLHCQQYSFMDKEGKRMTFTAPLPSDFEKIQNKSGEKDL